MQTLVLLQALADGECELSADHVSAAGDAVAEPEALIERLEAVGQIALELLGAAQVFDARRSALGGLGEAAAEGDQPWAVACELRVEGVAVEVDRVADDEPGVE